MLVSREPSSGSTSHRDENMTSSNDSEFEIKRNEDASGSSLSFFKGNDNDEIDESLIKNTLNYEEQLRRQTILNSLENMDYLLAIASQQQKSVEQVKHELMLKLVKNIP